MNLKLFDGGAHRSNLVFAVVKTSEGEKFEHTYQIVEADLLDNGAGGAIVYCSTRRRTEGMARFLQAKGVNSAFYHGGLSPEVKKEAQESFINGDVRVMVATNAFGMGIDKPDVRLVAHADIPGSLENYMQEAGRAGRDSDAARCVLLYTPEDMERQFNLAAGSRLSRREIQGVLKAFRNIDRRDKKNQQGGEVVATSGEILREDRDRRLGARLDHGRHPCEDGGVMARGRDAVDAGPEQRGGIPVLAEGEIAEGSAGEVQRGQGCQHLPPPADGGGPDIAGSRRRRGRYHGLPHDALGSGRQGGTEGLTRPRGPGGRHGRHGHNSLRPRRGVALLGGPFRAGRRLGERHHRPDARAGAGHGGRGLSPALPAPPHPAAQE